MQIKGTRGNESADRTQEPNSFPDNQGSQIVGLDTHQEECKLALLGGVLEGEIWWTYSSPALVLPYPPE